MNAKITNPHTQDWILDRARIRRVKPESIINAMCDMLVSASKQNSTVLDSLMLTLSEKRKHEIAEPRVATRTRRKTKVGRGV